MKTTPNSLPRDHASVTGDLRRLQVLKWELCASSVVVVDEGLGAVSSSKIKGHEIRNDNRLNKKCTKRVNECVSNNFGIGDNNNLAPLFCQN